MKTSLLSIVFLLFTAPGPSLSDQPYVNSNDINWRFASTGYDAAFAKAFRYRSLVGGNYAPLQAEDILFGEAEWAPGAIYVGHQHPAPEIYYVIEGRGRVGLWESRLLKPCLELQSIHHRTRCTEW